MVEGEVIGYIQELSIAYLFLWEVMLGGFIILILVEQPYRVVPISTYLEDYKLLDHLSNHQE